MKISRRGFAFGTAAVAAFGAAATGYLRLSGPHYPATPYDDLLHQIVDRKPAALLGKTAAQTMPHVQLDALAARLRQPGFALAPRAGADAGAGRVAEIGGWIVPESVALYSVLAASYA